MGLLTGGLDYIIPFIIVLTVLVFVHELGHYLVARWNHVRIEVFSIPVDKIREVIGAGGKVMPASKNIPSPVVMAR